MTYIIIPAVDGHSQLHTLLVYLWSSDCMCICPLTYKIQNPAVGIKFLLNKGDWGHNSIHILNIFVWMSECRTIYLSIIIVFSLCYQTKPNNICKNCELLLPTYIYSDFSIFNTYQLWNIIFNVVQEGRTFHVSI